MRPSLYEFADGAPQATDDAGLPDDPDFRQAMRDYMRWAVDDVLVYSPPDARVPEGHRDPEMVVGRTDHLIAGSRRIGVTRAGSERRCEL